MSRTALVIVANAVVAAVVAVGGVTASAGPLDGLGGITEGLPDLDGDGIDLPGGGKIDLPGGGNQGGVDLPGQGGSIDLPGSGAGGGVTDPITDPTDPTEPVPPDDGAGGGSSDGADGGAAGAGGPGGRGKGSVASDREETRRERNRVDEPIRRPDGVPTAANPTVSVADFGPAPLGCRTSSSTASRSRRSSCRSIRPAAPSTGSRGTCLASINRIETAFGTNLNVSTAGAQGWMQFMPATWEAYGVDANNDGRKDPYNPVDAICAAANYLEASGARDDLPGAIFAYNHADWYVDEVLLYARQYANIPGDLVSSITGLTEGARFPVAANARYADDVSERDAQRRGIAEPPAVADPPRHQHLLPRGRVRDRGQRRDDPQDRAVEAARQVRRARGQLREPLHLRRARHRWRRPIRCRASATAPTRTRPRPTPSGGRSGAPPEAEEPDRSRLTNTEDLRERLSAFPEREGAAPMSVRPLRAGARAARVRELRVAVRAASLRPEADGAPPARRGLEGGRGHDPRRGRIAAAELAPHLNFAIRPAGRGAPQINPKPILDGWKLLEATHLYRAMGKDPFADSAAKPGQVLLMSKEQAARALVAESGVSIYECGIAGCPQRADRRADHAAPALPRSQRLRPHGHLAQVRARRLHELGQRQRPLGRKRRRHRPDQRPAGPGQSGHRLDHRDADQADPRAAGRDDAGPGHLADGDGRPDVRDGRPRRPRPRRLQHLRRPDARRRPGRGAISGSSTPRNGGG